MEGVIYVCGLSWTNNTCLEWFFIVVHVLHNEQEYAEAVSLLDSLIDRVGENEQHPLASLMELVGVLISQYEETHVPEL